MLPTQGYYSRVATSRCRWVTVPGPSDPTEMAWLWRANGVGGRNPQGCKHKETSYGIFALSGSVPCKPKPNCRWWDYILDPYIFHLSFVVRILAHQSLLVLLLLLLFVPPPLWLPPTHCITSYSPHVCLIVAMAQHALCSMLYFPWMMAVRQKRTSRKETS